MLDLPNNKQVTLGDFELIKELKSVSSNNKLLIGAVRKLQKLGNKCTHTQNPHPISDNSVSDAIDALFNMYASIFVLYFQKYKFGTNNEVMSVFSILPPIIRYIVLSELYKNDAKNLLIIDKLSLVLLKAFDQNSAKQWIEERKDELSNTLPYTQEAIAEIEATYGKFHAQVVIDKAPESMYSLCLERVDKVSSTIDQQGLLYNNFEQAKQLYLDQGILSGDTEEYKYFNDIMAFVYLGRKIEENEKLQNQKLYNSII